MRLYKIGDAYFVSDGHHRVSVARHHGIEWIDARVTEYYGPSAPETRPPALRRHIGMPEEIADGVGSVMGPHGRSGPQVDRVTGELSAELRREPTEGELVERLDWTVEQVRDVKGTKPDAAGLSKLVSSQDGTSRLKDFILGETSCDVPDAVIEEKAAAWLREAIGRLPQKARYVLVRRYGLDDRDPATLAELAAELKLSRERVRQLQREAEFLLKSGTKRAPRPSVA